jgi:uncharacterized C2H2 Zn-finger protein
LVFSQRDVSEAQTVGMREPKMLDNGKLECPVCGRVFVSRQDYDNHWLTCHQDLDSNVSMASGSMGSMQPSGEESCETKTT